MTNLKTVCSFVIFLLVPQVGFAAPINHGTQLIDLARDYQMLSQSYSEYMVHQVQAHSNVIAANLEYSRLSQMVHPSPVELLSANAQRTFTRRINEYYKLQAVDIERNLRAAESKLITYRHQHPMEK